MATSLEYSHARLNALYGKNNPKMEEKFFTFNKLVRKQLAYILLNNFILGQKSIYIEENRKNTFPIQIGFIKHIHIILRNLTELVLIIRKEKEIWWGPLG